MLKDVQGEKDIRNIPLRKVGIKNLRWPVIVRNMGEGVQHTVADVSMAVDLPHDMRGTHMSRFVECLKGLGAVNPAAH